MPSIQRWSGQLTLLFVMLYYLRPSACYESCKDMYDDSVTTTGEYQMTLFDSQVTDGCSMHEMGPSLPAGPYSVAYDFYQSMESCGQMCLDWGDGCSAAVLYADYYGLCMVMDVGIISPGFYDADFYYDMLSSVRECEAEVTVTCNFDDPDAVITTLSPVSWPVFDLFEIVDRIEYKITYGAHTMQSVIALQANSDKCWQQVTVDCVDTSVGTWSLKVLGDEETSIPFAATYPNCDCLLDDACVNQGLTACACQGSGTQVDTGIITYAPIYSITITNVAGGTTLSIGPPTCSVPTADVDDCASAPCVNGGTCNDIGLTYDCECTPAWEGTDCDVDVNECSAATSPCLNDANCSNSPGSFTCICSDGFTGPYCETDLDECESDPCENGGSCVDMPGEYTCLCERGFDGNLCQEDFDECASDPCQNGGSCNNKGGMFTCDCVPGYSGVSCETDINECESSPCENGATCVDMLGDFGCDCAAGYDGDLCDEEIDDCTPDPCQNGATCEDLVNGYNCECALGFEGEKCETNIDECATDPCIHGTCVDDINKYNCECAPGYTGGICQTDVDECSNEPCQNKGVCEDKVNDYICVCLDGFEGKDCEINIDECESSPCMNSGQCKDGANRYSCQCNVGFTGPHCELYVIDGGWGGWGGYGECTSVCGLGIQIRYRQCSNPPPQNGGDFCVGDVADYILCNEDESDWECDNVDGGWGPWSDWGPCSATCGEGSKVKERYCNSPSPQGTGKDCEGSNLMEKSCTVSECGQAIDGGWGKWSEWSDCSKTCGLAEQHSVRDCDAPPPAFGGEPCQGRDVLSRPCDLDACPSYDDCDEWEEWSACSATCGSGSQKRKRQCRMSDEDANEDDDDYIKYKYQLQSCHTKKKCGDMLCQTCSKQLSGEDMDVSCRGPLKKCSGKDDVCRYDFSVDDNGVATLNKSCSSRASCIGTPVSEECQRLYTQLVRSVDADSPDAYLYLRPNKDTLRALLETVFKCHICCDGTGCNRHELPEPDVVVYTLAVAVQTMDMTLKLGSMLAIAIVSFLIKY